MTGTTASPLSLYREMQAAGVLLPSLLRALAGGRKRQFGEDKKSKELPPSQDKLQEMEKKKRETRHRERGMNEAMRAAETHCERGREELREPRGSDGELGALRRGPWCRGPRLG